MSYMIFLIVIIINSISEESSELNWSFFRFFYHFKIFLDSPRSSFEEEQNELKFLGVELGRTTEKISSILISLVSALLLIGTGGFMIGSLVTLFK